MKLQFRLLQHERLACSDCNETMEYGANVYIVPDKDVVLFVCELCHVIRVDAEKLGLIGGNRRMARGCEECM